MGSPTGVLVTLYPPAQAVTRPPSRLAATAWLSTKPFGGACRIPDNLIPGFLNSVSTASVALHAHVP